MKPQTKAKIIINLGQWLSFLFLFQNQWSMKIFISFLICNVTLASVSYSWSMSNNIYKIRVLSWKRRVCIRTRDWSGCAGSVLGASLCEVTAVGFYQTSAQSQIHVHYKNVLISTRYGVAAVQLNRRLTETNATFLLKRLVVRLLKSF